MVKEGPIINIKKAESGVRVPEKHQVLKGLAEAAIDELDISRVQELLKNITYLEKFILGVKYLEESTEYHKSIGKKKSGLSKMQKVPEFRRIYARAYRAEKQGDFYDEEKDSRDSLKLVVSGMINAMPVRRFRLLQFNPNRLVDFLKGEIVEFPTQFSSEKAETEEDIEEEPIIGVIDEVIKQKFKTLYLEGKPENILNSIRETFKALGVDVRVEFFNQANPDYGAKFIVIAENKDVGALGLLVPKPGTLLHMYPAFNFFKGTPTGVEVPPLNMVVLPRVKSEYKSHKSDDIYWKVIKLGEIKSPQ